MVRSRTLLAFAAAVMALLAVLALPTLAQSDMPAGAGYSENTITVTGYGLVHASPDIATVDVGVEVFKPTVTEAFTEANAKIQDILTALTNIGIPAEDKQTSNLSVFNTTSSDPESGDPVQGYTVSNTVHIIVRDISQVESVIDTAINAGATTLYGLSFDIQNRSALESQARQLAMRDAAARAQEYATLVNAQLGDAIVITETQLGNVGPVAYTRQSVGAANAVVAPGQTDVQIQVSVTYRIVR